MSDSAFLTRLNDSVTVKVSRALPATPSAFRSWVESWMLDALGTLTGPDLDPFANALDLKGRASVLRRPGVPYGEPGELWGTLWVDPAYRPGRSTKSSGQVWTPKNWDAFLGRLEEVPMKARVSMHRLAGDGFPGPVHWQAYMVREVDAPDFGTLSVRRSSQEFTDPATSEEVQRRWLDFLHRRLAADPEVLFGSLADDGESSTNRTELEAALGLFADETVPELDSVLRGYSWVTVCSDGVTRRLGGAESLKESAAFTRVVPLSGGGVLLQATEDIREYGPERVAAVFDRLRTVLPSGTPVPGYQSHVPRLVFEAP
ncbi:hypothetical protein P1P75_04925 [Streptomyces sp. ID05-39B]|uniref:hypothetical protein n=1 Tax=Streptomyces sp. ID05-39B TaxID=3028664 RepID=UPI0029A427B5|nr:hypothetical protein [Streptomyces sp. ID05-39B]MDX3525795.1 hypothetical protein [Streptomyces sp. ID05-39B]